jgi:predicted kinase
MSTSAKLILFCGKMAAGRSTLARDLAEREDAVLLVQDDFLDALFPGEITDIQAFVECYSRLKNALTPHICALLSKGISVVLDFAAATKAQRVWFHELIESTNVAHELHFCRRIGRLVQKSASEPKQGVAARHAVDDGRGL